MMMHKTAGARASTGPRSPFSALHLRRVCGTCAHFGAELIRTEAPCLKLPAGPRWGGTEAGDCPFWTRKTAGEGQG